MPRTMTLPKGIDDNVWSAALDYAQRGAAAIDPTDESIGTRRELLYHRLDLSATTEFKFFSETNDAPLITNLTRGRIAAGRVAILQGFAVDVVIGRDTAGVAGVSEVLGTHEGAAADATDETEAANAYQAIASKIDFLRHGRLNASVGTKKIFEDAFGLTRFPWPGGIDIAGPGYSVAGAYPATNNTKLGVLQANNGIASVMNMFGLCPNYILHDGLQLAARINLPANLSIPAGYKLTAIVGFDAQIFGPSNNT